MRGLFFGGALAGILLGFGLGLAIAWSFEPALFFGAAPADLRSEAKDDYLRMIASSYRVDGDMARAMQRVDALRLGQPEASVSSMVRREPAPATQQALIHLSLDMRQLSVALARPTFTPRPTKTRVTAEGRITPIVQVVTPLPPIILPSYSGSPEPTILPPTYAPNPNAPLFLARSRVPMGCNDTGGEGIFEFEVVGEDGSPLPGIGIEVDGVGGVETLYTGLKPERGLGYADFKAPPGVYNVRLVQGGRSEPVENLRINDEPADCDENSHQVRGWKLLFQRSE